MKDMMERVDAAERLLASLQRIGVSGAVCGGYVRDSILGRPIRDIDLYVKDDDFDKAYEHLFGDFPITCTWFDDESVEYKHQSISRHKESDASEAFAKALALPVRTIDLVGLHNTEIVRAPVIVERFNLGLSKAGLDKYGLFVHDDLRTDADDEQITLLRTDWGYEHSMKAFVKLQKKYPWPLRVREQEEL